MLTVQPIEHPRKTQAAAANVGLDERHPHKDFEFAHKVGDFQMDESGDMVPVIVCMSRQSGVGGYLADTNIDLDKQSWAKARAENERRGFIYIADDALAADGIPTLFAPYRTKRGRTTFRSAVQEPIETPDGVRWEHDAESWGAIVQALMVKGIIPPPSAMAIRSQLATIEAKIGVLAQYRPGSGDPRLSKWHRDYERTEKARDRLHKLLASTETRVPKSRRIVEALAHLSAPKEAPAQDDEESVLAATPAKPAAPVQAVMAPSVAALPSPLPAVQPTKPRGKPGPKPGPKRPAPEPIQAQPMDGDLLPPSAHEEIEVDDG